MLGEREHFLLDARDACGIGVEVALVLQVAPQQPHFLDERDEQGTEFRDRVGGHPLVFSRIIAAMWTKQMGGPRKKAPRTIAVIDPDRCFGAYACSICQAACPVAA